MRFAIEAPIAKRRVAWLALGGLTIGLGTVAIALDWRFRLVPLFCFFALAVFSIVNTYRAPRKPSKSWHRVVADATGLTIDDARFMERAEIATAYSVPADDGLFAVHIEGRPLRRGCTVYVASEEEAKSLLAALECDLSQARTHFRALPPWARHLRWLVVILTASPWVIINLLRHIPMWGLGVIAMLYGLIAIPTILPQRVDVGHDGIFLRWFGNKRFIPFSKILHVSATKVGVDIHLLSGREIEIRLTQKDGGADAQVKALFKRIEAGMADHRDLAHADEEAFLARGERTVETWLREMRALGAGDRGGYRVNSIPRDRLWAVVENPAADPSARQGAALALSTSLEEEERVRLLALAQKTASPRVRIALDGVGRAASGADDASRSQEETRLRVALETADRELEERDSGSMPAAKAAERRARKSG